MADSTPQCLYSEQFVLGACLVERDAISQAMASLREEDFYRDHHKKIYKVIRRLFDKGAPVDVVVVAEELRRTGQLEECGGSDYLLALVESCPSSNVGNSARIVRDKSLLRRP
ncbi:hypothetical protein EON83_16700 [bacterium]|nr:MAG: hypothetical protein EON83_16700 [bacterium]